MIITNSGQNFKGIRIGKLNPLHTVYLTDIKSLEKFTDGVDVFIKSVSKNFPYRKSQISVPSIKITARPQNLGFIDRLLGRKTVKNYFPVGSLRSILDFEDTFESLFMKTIEKVKK